MMQSRLKEVPLQMAIAYLWKSEKNGDHGERDDAGGKRGVFWQTCARLSTTTSGRTRGRICTDWSCLSPRCKFGDTTLECLSLVQMLGDMKTCLARMFRVILAKLFNSPVRAPPTICGDGTTYEWTRRLSCTPFSQRAPAPSSCCTV
mmetsp:Transcript_91367/g.261540  ORF Transcript_91367/g.261540 Transcript_91367/m.261540 type:complete len:147 (-) Transcript_91367:198-638(-)